MSRYPRNFAYSQIYHVILKGIDGHDIFYDNNDKDFFLKQLLTTKQNFNLAIYSYCLMFNHVHLVIKCPNELLSKSIQSLQIRYVSYFNKKYERTGHLFQGRFKSKVVENQKYFLELCRYVHRNPENAGISLTQKYEWSSYKEYLGEAKIINKNILLHYFNNNLNDFIYYTIGMTDIDDIEDFVEYEIINKLSDAQLASIIIKKFNLSSISQINLFFKNRDINLLKDDLKKITSINGTNITQIARVIRINRKLIKRLL